MTGCFLVQFCRRKRICISDHISGGGGRRSFIYSPHVPKQENQLLRHPIRIRQKRLQLLLHNHALLSATVVEEDELRYSRVVGVGSDDDVAWWTHPQLNICALNSSTMVCMMKWTPPLRGFSGKLNVVGGGSDADGSRTDEGT
ncbi:hypothetical protein PM082_021444 [Marasmius tenuissimus]|nr:hypothetical protein PM082_021444 [Marasmius tenuissimus]